jgi:hypothetical protein
MLLRNPQPDPDLRRKFNETETIKELPAAPKSTSLHPSWYQQSVAPPPANNWHESLPKPQQLPIFREPIDLEKWAARLTWACFILFGVLLTVIFMGKMLAMAWALK